MALYSALKRPIGVLFFPETFFSKRADRLDDAGRVVLAVAGLHLIGYYLLLVGGAVIAAQQHYSLRVLDLLTDLDGWVYGQGLLLALLVVLNWLVVGAVLHVAVKLRHGNGTVVDTLSVVGCSSPAALLTLLVGGAGFLLAVAGNTMVMSFDAKLAAVGPAVTAAGIVGGLLTLLWQGRIWLAGLQRTHDIERTTAAQAAAATVVLCGIALMFGP